jgi:hypothetical protein
MKSRKWLLYFGMALAYLAMAVSFQKELVCAVLVCSYAVLAVFEYWEDVKK